MPSAPVYCGHPVPPAEPEMWVSWQYVLDILLEELNTFSDAGRRLLHHWRMYGDIGRKEMLAKDELPEDGTEGFRLYYCACDDQYCEFALRKDGSLYMRSTIVGPTFPTEASTMQPSDIALEEFHKGLEWLMLR